MTNVALLKMKIIERSTTQEAVADEMGINRSTFYRKLKENGLSFSIEEVHRLVSILSLTNDDVMHIFFAKGVA